MAWWAAGLFFAASLVVIFGVAQLVRLVGRAEGWGVGLFALSVAALGVALALRARGWLRALVAVSAGAAVFFLVFVTFVLVTLPDFDAVRTIEFTRLPDETNATTLDTSFVPAALRADLVKWNVTDHSSTSVPKPEATRFWDAAAARTGYQMDGHRGYVLRVDGRVYDFSYGPVV